MARKEQWSVGELTITKGIRAGKDEKLAKVLRMYSCVPALIDADEFFTGNMANGAYTLLLTVMPDALAHNITVAQTAVGAEDTNGIITVVGTDINGLYTTEVITPNAGVTIQGTKAFKTITSITGSGWVIGEGNDTIVIGYGELVGLPEKVALAADILMVAHNTALVNAPTATVSSTVTALNTVTVPTGDGTKVLRVIYQV